MTDTNMVRSQLLAVREMLEMAARGTLAIHIVKESGCWTVELWRDGEIRAIDGDVRTVAEALDRAGRFISMGAV